MSRRSLTALLCAAQVGIFSFFLFEEGVRLAVTTTGQESAVCSNRTGIDVAEAVRSAIQSDAVTTVAPRHDLFVAPEQAKLITNFIRSSVAACQLSVDNAGHQYFVQSRAPPAV